MNNSWKILFFFFQYFLNGETISHLNAYESPCKCKIYCTLKISYSVAYVRLTFVKSWILKVRDANIVIDINIETGIDVNINIDIYIRNIICYFHNLSHHHLYNSECQRNLAYCIFQINL